MKKIGIIGGLGPEATVDYYKEIIGWFNARSKEMNYPEILIYSINISELMVFTKASRNVEATRFLLDKVHALQRAGADFVAMSANTPHIYFEGIKVGAGLPLISIVEATCREAKNRGLKRLGLFGTAFTMKADFYQLVFEKAQIEIVLPDAGDIEIIHEKLFSEIELGIFKDETRQQLLEIVQRMIREKQIDSLILGCTEFPLVFREEEYFGIPFLNTTRIHVEEIIAFCLSE